MNRTRIYEIIDTERRHQDLKWGPLDKHPHEVGGWLTIMRTLLTKAEAAWSSSNGDHGALEEIRKVAAVAVACGEQHGLRARHITEHKGSEREGASSSEG
jgi:hypothetical protein